MNRGNGPSLVPFTMRTKWGRRRKWELQRSCLNGADIWRVTGAAGWCHPATPEEVALWHALDKDLTRVDPRATDPRSRE